MVIIGIIGCLLILGFVHLVLKDVLSPPFILSGIWLFMYTLLFIIRGDSVDLSSPFYLSFLGGLCFFIFGFFLVVINNNKVNCGTIKERKSNLRFKLPYIQIFLLITIILFSIYLIKAIHFISQEFDFNYWRTLSIGKKTGKFEIPIIIEYSRSAVIALSIVCSIVFFNNPSKINKRYFIISGIIALFYVITSGNRGAIFIWIISLTFSYLIIKNYSNKKLFYVLVRLALVILTVFIVTNFAKYVYSDQSDAIKFSQYLLKHYFTSSPIAFVEWMKSAKEYTHGANTFRFFLAIYNNLGGNIDVVETVQDPIQITKLGEETNVYTVLHYYARDFGLIYALLIQIFLGIWHGFLYKKSILADRATPFFIALQSIFYYPLFYQFFSDQYFTLFSSWLQYILWFWIFTNRAFLSKGLSELRSNKK